MTRSILTSTARPRRPRRSATLLTALAAGVLVLSACSSDAGGSSASGEVDPNAVIKVGTGHVPASLDPCAGNNGYDIDYMQPIYARLIYADQETLALEPGIATEWEFADEKTFTFTIQEGLTFQDGTPLDAEAVKKSMDRCLSQGVVVMPTIKSIDVTGPSTLSISLTAPTSGLPSALNTRLGMIVSPTAVEKYGDEFAVNPVGAGPFSLKGFVPNTSYSYVRNESYKQAGPPPAQAAGIDVQIISNPTALANALSSKAVDFAYGLFPATGKTLDANESLTVRRDPRLGMALVVINSSNESVADPRIRLAMQHAIDREALAKAALTTDDGVASSQMYPKASQFYDEDAADAWPYDPAKSKKLLAEAGFPDGVTIDGIVAAAPPFDTNAVILEEQWAKVGIKVNFTKMAGPQSISAFVENKDDALDVFSVGWPGNASPALNFNSMLASTSYFRQNSQKHDELDALIAELNATYEVADQLEVVKKINQFIIEDGTLIPLYSTPDIVAFDKSVKGSVPALNGAPEWSYLGKS